MFAYIYTYIYVHAYICVLFLGTPSLAIASWDRATDFGNPARHSEQSEVRRDLSGTSADRGACRQLCLLCRVKGETARKSSKGTPSVCCNIWSGLCEWGHGYVAETHVDERKREIRVNSLYHVCRLDLYILFWNSRIFTLKMSLAFYLRQRIKVLFVYFFFVMAMSKLKTVALKSYCGIYLYISIYANIARAISFTRFARAFFLSSPLPNAHPLLPFTSLAFEITRCDDSSSRSRRIDLSQTWSLHDRGSVNIYQYLCFVISRLTYECSHRDTRLVNISDKMSTTTDVNDLADVPKEGTPIFLQTRAAQVIAGIFVWIALFLTCQQVSTIDRTRHLL